ncbi:hypothetical protein HOY80DRAFT_1036776 [Tuber brumale]|nr:hypothetical protein HOY80DRAFT_1036776 [Tuber brumale]
MGFEAVAYARSTILEDCIKDIGEAFSTPPATKNAGGFANPPIEKEPGATAPTAKTTTASRSTMSTPAESHG